MVGIGHLQLEDGRTVAVLSCSACRCTFMVGYLRAHEASLCDVWAGQVTRDPIRDIYWADLPEFTAGPTMTLSLQPDKLWAA